MHVCTYIFLLKYSLLTTKPVCCTVCISCSCGKSGFADVKRHAFFRGIEWSSALAELIVPPMVPTVQSEGDSSNFDSYPDEQADEASNLTQAERELFTQIDTLLERPVKLI